MPWCPKCKMEYRKEITVCADCKVELVEELPSEDNFVPFFQSEDKNLAEKLVRYFKYSKLESKVHYDEENEIFVLSIPPKQEKQAKKLYQAFYFVERDELEKVALKKAEAEQSSPRSDEANNITLIKNENKEVMTDTKKDTLDLSEEATDSSIDEKETDDLLIDTESQEYTDEEFTENKEDENSTTYVMKEDQYKDLTGTVWVFLIFGIAGLIFILLNVVGVLSIFNGLIPNIVMGALFLSFIYISISTNQKAKKIQTEIEAENKLTDEINQWLKLHVTKSFLSSIHNDNISEELNYIKEFDVIKELIIKDFTIKNLAYLDRIIDEYYSKTFD